MIGRPFWRTASTVVKRKIKVPAGEAASATANTATPVSNGKMAPPRPVLTPLQKRQSPFAEQAIPLLDSSLPFPCIANFSLPSSALQSKLSKSLRDAAVLFGGNYLVWRGDLMTNLGTFLKENKKVLLNGNRGAGKSSILLQAFVSLLESVKEDSSRLLLYVPDAAKWTTGYFSFYPTASGEYEQPDLALEVLKLLQLCNPGKQLPFTAEDTTAASKDPLSLAMPLYTRVMSEIKASGMKLTVLADGVNGLLNADSKTDYNDADGQSLPLKSFPLCRDFIGKADVFIGALTSSNPMLPTHTMSELPTFTVPKYSDGELSVVLEMYRKLGHLSVSSAADEQFLAMKAFVSGRNARLLFKSCEFDSIYKSK